MNFLRPMNIFLMTRGRSSKKIEHLLAAKKSLQSTFKLTRISGLDLKLLADLSDGQRTVLLENLNHEVNENISVELKNKKDY